MDVDVPLNLESIEGKRDREENGDGVKESSKKPRFGNEINRVAEIVLVLSSLRNIRGGKSPTEFEMELMVEAKSKLVEICQEFPPKDLIGKEAVKAVIEDLGLNDKLKDQRLGFRVPKLTISEKLSLGQRKMEESKKHQIVSTSYTSPANNVSMAHQWPKSEIKASASSVNSTGSQFGRDASGITQTRPQFKSDMHTSASQGQISAGNYFGNAASWSAQPHSSSSTISFGTASDSKVHAQSSSRVTNPSFRPFMSQTPPGSFPGMKGVVTYGQTSSSFGNNHHAEIAKIIHKVLQPQAKQNQLWNPPSRAYMSKAMTCQMCQGTINEIETVLICDACEKGYHLKCLQANNMKGVPKSEWHCSRCLQLYNGKSFPPKYGRVMRSETTTKTSSSNTDVQLPLEKKTGKVDLKVVNQEVVSRFGTAKASEYAVANNQTVEAKDAGAKGQMAKAEDAVALSETVEAKEAAALSQTLEAKDAATIRQTVEAGDAATDEDEDAATDEAEEEDEDAATDEDEAEDEDEDASTDEDGDASTDEAEDAATDEAEDAATDEAEEAATVEAEDTAAINQTVEAEDVAMNQGDETNHESEGPIGEDSLESVSQSETLNPPKLDNVEDPSKGVIAESVSADLEDKNLKIIAESSLLEENSLPSQPASQQSNTDHSQEQNITPNGQDTMQKNVIENPQEDKSC